MRRRFASIAVVGIAAVILLTAGCGGDDTPKEKCTKSDDGTITCTIPR